MMADAWKAYTHLPEMPTEVYADPGRHDWYFREKKPDSVAKFIRADLTPPAAVIEAMERALQHCLGTLTTGMDGVWDHTVNATDLTRAALAALTAWRAGK